MDEYTREILEVLAEETLKSIKRDFIAKGVSKEDTVKVFEVYRESLKEEHDRYCPGGSECHYDDAMKAMFDSIDKAYEEKTTTLTAEEIEKLAAEKL